ncbi:hypothetical protein HanPI659440_Chr09g0324081 [Helianthus annuus]|nr:hypothetical protein HanPI659440_Chr09g0324081 [Helianthus annuus]
MAGFTGILEFIERLPIQKALRNQHLVFRSHIERFWENATYDEENKTINSIVSLNGQDKPIIITEQLVREVINFPDDENSPTKFPDRMVKGCMSRMGYNGPLNKANYLKACFPRLYKFIVHSVLHALSHRKGGYDVMRDYQMNMVTALVDEKNDLLVLYHMDNESLKQLDKYHPNHPKPSSKVEFFGLIKDKNYQDPDPINHQNWRNEKEMKEKSYADELKALAGFKESRNEWFLKEEKKKKSRKATPKVQVEEEAEAEAEAEAETAGEEGDDVDKSSSSSSDEEIDETKRAKRIKAEIEKEKQLKRKRKEDKDDELYNPSPEHVIESQTPPSSGGRKK